MESLSTEQRELVQHTLENIQTAIGQLQDWNKDLQDENSWYTSNAGMQLLAADCMLIEAIGEGVKQLLKRVGIEWLSQRPEIPWYEISGMRNHIAHGYFEIDGSFVFSVIKNDIEPLNKAVTYLIGTL